MYLKRNDKIFQIPDHIVLCGCALGHMGIQIHFSIKNVIRKHHKNHYVFELTGSNSLFIFSLTLRDINLQNISQQTKVITFIEKANSAKSGGTVLYLSPNRCRLWAEQGGLDMNPILSRVWLSVDGPLHPQWSRCPEA